MRDISGLVWPLSRLAEGMAWLSYRAGISGHPEHASAGLDKNTSWDDVWKYVDLVSERISVESEVFYISYAQVPNICLSIAPAVVCAPRSNHSSFFLLLARKGKNLICLAPDLELQKIPINDFVCIMRAKAEAPVLADIQATLAAVGVSPSRQLAAREALLHSRLGNEYIATAWIMRMPPGASPWRVAQSISIPQLITANGLIYFTAVLVYVLGWAVLGRGLFSGQSDWSWMWAWALLIMGLVPLRVFQFWFSGLFSAFVGWFFKQRLLLGATHLNPDETRSMGVGKMLGQTIESDAAEAILIDGGILLLSHLIDLLIAIPLLLAGVGGWLHVGLLLLWVLTAAILLFRYVHLRHEWTNERLGLTHVLVEQMVGHQTRQAQLDSGKWNMGDDGRLDQYLRISKKVDTLAAAIKAIPARAWLFLSILSFIPSIIAGNKSIQEIALGLAGALFLYQNMPNLMSGLLAVADSLASWKQVEPMFKAASRPWSIGRLDFSSLSRRSDSGSEGDRVVLLAANVSYRYPDRVGPALNSIDLSVNDGERLLISGPSGGGKSTLVSILSGLRQPQSGMLLMNGIDYETAGMTAWRRMVAVAPQFHENHVFLGPMAFNLLLSHNWPPTQEDLDDAEKICEELGLSGLLRRMPGGVWQQVGETGWQLSHGERSRLFIARALLQRSPIVILDESLAALDAGLVQSVMSCALRRAKTLIVVAHP